MKKILAPTDFSGNSKSGIRFAIHWAAQQKVELVFIHVLHILRPTIWSDTYFEKYAVQEEKKCSIKFKKFIAAIYIDMNVKPGKHSFVIIQGIITDVAILDYCRKNKYIDYICISTRGAGKFKKIFGTNTGNLITKSAVPVLAVPKTYKVANIKNVLYAADFRNYSEEINKVVDFALPLKATIEVLHFTWPDKITFDKKNIESTFKKQYKYGLKIHFEKNDAVHTLIQNLQSQIRIRKPSVVTMFTNQQRTFFQKLFLSSKAEELSFQTKVPLLVFNKL
jgi:nucleotide-binding universal stress UspA family protein